MKEMINLNKLKSKSYKFYINIDLKSFTNDFCACRIVGWKEIKLVKTINQQWF